MSLYMENKLKIKCSECGKIIELDVDFDYEAIGKREMGVENVYSNEVNYICGCGNIINIKYLYYEYSIGSHSDSADEYRIEGGDLVE